MERTDWRPLYGFEDHYDISRDGQVRNRETGHHLTVHIDGYGYPAVQLMVSKKTYHRRLHRVLLQTFVGPQPGMWALHADDDRLNFSLSNLRWGTRQDNTADAHRNGGTKRIGAERRSRTHCFRGHAYTDDNTLVKRDSAGRLHRRCRRCHADGEFARRKR